MHSYATVKTCFSLLLIRTRSIILRLDVAQERRRLSPMEFNLWKILKQRVIELAAVGKQGNVNLQGSLGCRQGMQTRPFSI